MIENQHHRGFSMLELMISMAIFLIISAAALGLFTQDEPVYTRQQNQSGLNIGIRNAIAQLQLDVVNGGAGYYPPGSPFPVSPVGVSIVNNWVTSATPCNTPATYTYGANCFDTLNVIAADPNAAPSHPDNGTFTANPVTDCINTSTASTIYLYPPTGVTGATLAAAYHKNDQIMLVTTSGDQFTTTTITATPTTFTANGVTGVQLSINKTGYSGVSGANAQTPSPSNDLLGITWDTTNPKLGSSFCSTDWVTRLAPITYSVNTSNPSDPQLVRTQGLGGTQTVLADQIIGFKVGADTWNLSSLGCVDASVSVDTTCFDYKMTDYSSDFTLIRAIQISMIGRTTPNPGATYTYRNGFDGGPYQIEGVSVEINPRNMSMNNN
jgi:prepilin-type N-terminal cleavage/methylation domain-containing protein